MMRERQVALIIWLMLLALPSSADTTNARCDIYAAGNDHADASIPCVFSQRQGSVTISRSDDVVHELRPQGDTPGNYIDQDGNVAYRQQGLGADGLIFRLVDQSVYVYWSTEGLPGESSVDRSQPFSTADYDATMQLRCYVDKDDIQQCPAAASRMDNGQASITIRGIGGDQFTINFMTDYTNAAGHDIEATLINDTWQVVVDGSAHYEVPRAAIEGG